MKQKLLDYIDAHREALFALLCDMIDINTENDGKSGNEAPLATYIQRTVKAHCLKGNYIYEPGGIFFSYLEQ